MSSFYIVGYILFAMLFITAQIQFALAKITGDQWHWFVALFWLLLALLSLFLIHRQGTQEIRLRYLKEKAERKFEEHKYKQLVMYLEQIIDTVDKKGRKK